MSPSMVQPQGHLSPAEALQLAQQAPTILQQNPKAISKSPLSALFSATETVDLWTIYENLLLSCLRTGDEQSAHQCLERLVLRFGDKNERIMALKGLVKEAEAEDKDQLRKVLDEYQFLLRENPSNIPISKRRVALLRSVDEIPQAISALTDLLNISPTDPEAWSELADLYLSQGIYAQAIFSLEEVLVLTPNAWNMHACLGEVLLMAAEARVDAAQNYLAEALKRFCRSVELCDDYLRGYYGLKKVTDQLLLESVKSKNQNDADSFTLPHLKNIQKLNQLATDKLAEIVRRNIAGEKLWQGYSPGEISAARALLDKATAQQVR